MKKREKHIGKYLNYKTIASEMGTKKRSLPTWCQAARLALSIIRKGFFFFFFTCQQQRGKTKKSKKDEHFAMQSNIFRHEREAGEGEERRVGRGGSKKNKQLLWVLRKAA